MNELVGIDRIVYGAEDLTEGKRFFLDWGLTLVEEVVGDKVVFETLEKSQIVLRPLDADDLPSPIEEGPTIVEIVWGAKSQHALDSFINRVGSRVNLHKGADGLWRCLDPNGLSLAFQVSQTIKSEHLGTPTNSIGHTPRIDKAAPVYDRATPTRIAHAVFFVEDLTANRIFYIDTLGFNITDEYPGRGLFMRCVTEGTHHNLFMLQIPNRKKGINHLSFCLRDIYEVMGGGIHFSNCGWKTQLGPGRHPISSAFFWYFHSPLGGLVEYYADEDYLTGDWQPRQHESTPENYAEWAIVEGIDADTRRQKLRKIK